MNWLAAPAKATSEHVAFTACAVAASSSGREAIENRLLGEGRRHHGVEATPPLNQRTFRMERLDMLLLAGTGLKCNFISKLNVYRQVWRHWFCIIHCGDYP